MAYDAIEQSAVPNSFIEKGQLLGAYIIANERSETVAVATNKQMADKIAAALNALELTNPEPETDEEGKPYEIV